MKESKKTSAKPVYKSPEIEQIRLDNEISLVLQSSPPEGPAETFLQINPHHNNIFLKSELG